MIISIDIMDILTIYIHHNSRTIWLSIKNINPEDLLEGSFRSIPNIIELVLLAHINKNNTKTNRFWINNFISRNIYADYKLCLAICNINLNKKILELINNFGNKFTIFNVWLNNNKYMKNLYKINFEESETYFGYNKNPRMKINKYYFGKKACPYTRPEHIIYINNKMILLILL